MPQTPVRVLLIQQDDAPAEAVKDALAGAKDSTYALDWVRTLAEGLEKLSSRDYDAVLLDLSLADSAGLDTFDKVDAAVPDVPIVLLTEAEHEPLAIEAVRRGAQDYIAQDPLNTKLLLRELRYAIERERIQAHLERLADFAERNANPIIETDGKGGLAYRNEAARAAFPDLDEKGTSHPVLDGLAGLKGEPGRKRKHGLAGELKLGDRTYERRIHPSAGGGLRLFVLDVTDRAHADQKKDDFFHHVTHEMRSPLSSIQSGVSLLLEGVVGELKPEQKDFLEIVHRNVGHLRCMVDDLLETTRAATGKLTIHPRRMFLQGVIGDVVKEKRIAAGEKGVVIEDRAHGDLPALLADPVRTRQVLMNLIDNSLKFTPKGGSIFVGARAHERQRGNVLVQVTDTGRGIDPEAAKRIFGRLYQVKPGEKKGLGLGLYICRQIVTQHGGRIWLETELGKGTTFLFTLPRFSLMNILYPLLAYEDQTAPEFTLLTAELFPSRNELQEQIAFMILREARALMRRNLREDDVVLPELSPPGKEGLVFAATTDAAENAERIAARLAELFSQIKAVKLNMLKPSVRCATVKVPRQGGASPHSVVRAASMDLETRLLKLVDKR